MQRPLLLTLACIALSATAASAQNIDVIKERRAALSAMGKATKEPSKMMKGEIDFDLAKVKAALATYQEKAAKLPDLFPEDSKKGGDTDETNTEALPALWENKDDVVKRFKELAAAAKDAEGKISDEFEFQEVFPKVVGNCGNCHKKYRVEKK